MAYVDYQDITFQGASYLQYWAIPKLYFHLTTAYDILRHYGGKIGKHDFPGKP